MQFNPLLVLIVLLLNVWQGLIEKPSLIETLVQAVQIFLDGSSDRFSKSIHAWINLIVLAN